MIDNNLKQFIENIPKAELHVHLEGTLEPELKFELADRNNVKLSHDSVEEERAAYEFDGLTPFLKLYFEGAEVLQTEQDFYDLALAYLKKAHSHTVLYTEMFFDPQAHTSRGVNFETVITGIHRAQEDAKEQLGIESKLIMNFLRDMSAESAMETLEAALPYKDWLIGVGLDSEIEGNPPNKFKAVFERAKQTK